MTMQNDIDREQTPILAAHSVFIYCHSVSKSNTDKENKRHDQEQKPTWNQKWKADQKKMKTSLFFTVQAAILLVSPITNIYFSTTVLC